MSYNFTAADWQNLYNTDPQYRALVSSPSTSLIGAGGNGSRQERIRAYLKSKGLPDLPEGAAINQQGQFVQDTTGWGAFAKYGLPALGGIVAAPLIAGAIGGAAGAGAAGAAGSGAGASAGAAGAGAGAAGAGAATAAAASPSLWSAIAAPVISGGASVAGAAIAAHGATSAANTAAASADKALAWQKELYAQQRNDTAPGRAAYQGAVGKLSYGLGVPGFENGPLSNSPQNTAARGVAKSVMTPQAPQQPTLPGQASPTAQQQTAQVGTRRLINGQLGEWDGQGWKAVQGAA